MTAGAHAATADRVMAALDGCRAAQRVLQQLREGMAAPDLLFDALQGELAAGNPERLRGWAREVQKSLERAA